MKKVAFLLKGSVSKKTGRIFLPGQVNLSDQYVNFYACYNSIKKHILSVNHHYEIDFFIHSWNTDLKEELENLYKPKMSLFENNDLYKEEILSKIYFSKLSISSYGQISQCLSIKKCCDLVEKYKNETHTNYDLVIIYRPDLLLWKDMKLDTYEEDKIIVNNYLDCLGDFHFVMNYENMLLFKNVYNNLHFFNCEPHAIFKPYINNILKKNVYMDSIKAGLHQEVIRKLKNINFDLNIEQYGLTKAQIDEYIL
jgi:hypothetical protein